MSELISLAKKYTPLFFLVLSVFAVAYLYYWFDQNETIKQYFIGVLVSAALASLFTGFCIAIAEKYGWLSNYRDEMEELSSKINELPASLEARLTFGLDEMHNNFDEASFLEKHKGGEICWLNTYFDTWRDKRDIFRRAIKNNSRIRLLFMHPNSSARVQRAYYSCEFEADVDITKHNDRYNSRLLHNVTECVGIIAEMHQEFPDMRDDDISIKFYQDAAQLPIIIGCDDYAGQENQYFKEVDGRKYRPSIGASGFYLDKYSRHLPYITWRIKGADEKHEIVIRMYEYFNKKWNAQTAIELNDVIKELEDKNIKLEKQEREFAVPDPLLDGS